MVRSKGERTAAWVVLAVLIIGPLLQLFMNGFGQLASFRFWFGLYGWLALGLVLAYPVYLMVTTDEDAVAAMARAAPAAAEAGGADMSRAPGPSGDGRTASGSGG